MKKRRICDKEILPLGFGCWAIGGPWTMRGGQAGWGVVDDAVSINALQRAYDKGIQLFDTAANYGAGHSEEVLGRALKSVRQDVLIATKFGYQVDVENKAVDLYGGELESTEVAGHVKEECEKSLKRLGTDYIDLYQFHVSKYPAKLAEPIIEQLEELVKEGKIRYYGWSTDTIESALLFARQKNCTAIQHDMNCAQDAPEMVELCETYDLASVNRRPLAMGLLSGKYKADSVFPSKDNRNNPGFKRNRIEKVIPELDKLKPLLVKDGRSMVQGALGWLWARSSKTIPIPGMRTVEQVEENCKALDFGPLDI